MSSEEVHIISDALNSVINADELASLKKQLGSEEAYNNFLIDLFEVLIGKNANINVKSLLNLYNHSENLNKIEEKSTDIIEELADSFFKGYRSDYTAWLIENKNEVFLSHLSFLKDTKTTVTALERQKIKQRFSDLEKIESIELTDAEIKNAVTKIERVRLKERFNELYAEYSKANAITVEPPKKKNPYAVVILLICVTSFVFAVANPTIRNFIIKQFQVIFSYPTENNKEGEGSVQPTEILKPGKDSVAFQKQNQDTVNSESLPAPLPKKESKPKFKLFRKNKLSPDTTLKHDTIKKISKARPLLQRGLILSNEKEYNDFFKTHRDSLQSIEGMWLLYITNKSNRKDGFKIKCAVIRIGANKFKMIHFNQDGSLLKTQNLYYLQRLSVHGDYKFNICRGFDKLFESTAFYQIKRGFVSYEAEYLSALFNNSPHKEYIGCEVWAFKRK